MLAGTTGEHTSGISRFKPGDGTGKNSEVYSLENLTTPAGLQLDTNFPDRVVPRPKDVVLEAALPVGTLHDQRFHQYLVSLTQLGVSEQKIKHQRDIGISQKYFCKALEQPPIEEISLDTTLDQPLILPDPKVYLTVGYGPNGRFGDPHAIYCQQYMPNVMQFVAFLTLTNTDNPLYEKLSELGIEPQ